MALVRAAAVALLLVGGGGCADRRADFRLEPGQAGFGPQGVVVTLPAGHPLTTLELRDAGGALLLVQPVPPGQPLTLPLETPWAPGERLTLVGRAAGGRRFSLPLTAPPRLPAPVEVTLELPGGVPVPGGGSPLFLPVGAEISLALSLRGRAPRPLGLSVTLTPPANLQPLPETGAAATGPEATRNLRLELPQQTERLTYRFRVASGAGRISWRVAGAGLPGPIEGGRRVAGLDPAALRAGLWAEEQGFPADAAARLLAHRPRDTLVFSPPWTGPLAAVFGTGEPRDPYQPAGFARVMAHNRLAGDVVALVRTWVAARPGGAPLPAFGDPLRGPEGRGSHTLARIPAGTSLPVAQAVFFDEGGAAPGQYWRCSELRPWGIAAAAPPDCVPFQVVKSPLWRWAAIWAGTALGVGLFLLGVGRLGAWVGRFELRELVLIALMAGLAFLLVSLPGLVLRTVTLFLLGPFNFLVEGLVFKGLLFLLLGALFALVRRPGVFFLFYCLWMVAQAVLNGHTSPATVLFAGVTITFIEAGLWLGGVTRPLPGSRGRPPPWLWAALAVGLAEALSVFWTLQMLKVLYRVFFADWFVLLQSGTEGLYAALGVALGLRVGARLAGMQRPGAGFSVFPPGVPPLSAPAAAAAPAPLLKVSGLTFAYPGAPTPLLENAGFELAPGEIVLLAGNSGSGKTTLFRLLKGLLPWPEGAGMWFRGRPVAGESPAAMAGRLGLLFQEPALQVVRATVAGEVAFGMELAGAPPAQRQAALARWLPRLGLAPLAGRRLDTLSGGELQKTALAAVLAPGPPVALLDEPLAHLDPAGRKAFLASVRGLAAEGCAVLIAEHRTQAVLPLVDRVLLLEPGRPLWCGGPAAFRRTPWFRAAAGALAGLSGAANGAARGTRPERPGPSGRSPFSPAPVQLRGLTFSHRRGQAPQLHAAGPALAPGGAVALTGPNGAGKTTLLTLLLGLRRPQAGSLTIGEKAAHALSWPEKARRFGYLPQQAELVLQAPTVAAELAASLRWRGWPRPHVTEAVALWLERIGLAAAAERFPHLLSRGERQRLALASVMIAGPPLLVLDEPFAGQDAHQTAALLCLCRDFLAGAPGRSLIAATHDLEPVRGFFDAEWRLDGGALAVHNLREAAGSPGVAAAGGGS